MWHMSVIYGLLDIYTALAKAQHGVSKINQFPWNYSDRVTYLKDTLNKIASGKMEKGMLHDRKSELELCQFPDGSSIRTEFPRHTRNVEDPSGNSEVEKGLKIIRSFAKSISCNVGNRIKIPDIFTMCKDAFHNWDDVALERLISIANNSIDPLI